MKTVYTFCLSLFLSALALAGFGADHYLDYIQGSGANYTTVPLKPTGAAVFELDATVMRPATTEPLFECLDSAGHKIQVVNIANNGLRFDYNTTNGNQYRKLSAGTRCRVAITNGTAMVDGTLLQAHTYADFTVDSPFLSLHCNYYVKSGGAFDKCNTFSMSLIHGLKVYTRAGENDALTLAYDLRPYEQDGRPGFRNEVDGAFYPSNTTSQDFNVGTYLWKGGSGLWTQLANWQKDSLAQENRVPGTSYPGDVASFNNVDATITFPTGVAQTDFNGKIEIQGPSPTSAGDAREVVFDSRGTIFNNVTSFLTQPFAKGWSYDTSKKTWNSADALFFYKGTTPGYLKFSDALVRVTLATSGVRMVQDQGSFRSDRSFHVQGFNNGAGLTNWTEVVVNDGDFVTPLKLRANSRFYFNSNGSFGNGNLFLLLPGADNSGDNFGGGRAECYWTAGTNTSTYVGMQIGVYGGADAYLAMSGTAYFHRGGTGNGTPPDITIASGTPSNSGPTIPVRGEMIVSDAAGVRILGRNDSGNQFGNLSIACQGVATAIDATGLLTVKDDAFFWLDKGRIRIASGEGARGYLTVEGRGVVKALGTVTAKLVAADVGIRLGGAKSKEAVVTIRDEALIETPRVAAVDTSTHASFIRNALVLEGGTLKTSKIEGSALDVVVSGGTIQARAATTSAAPLIAGDLHAWTFTGKKTLTIDTQEFDTYVDACFPADAIIVKKGSGALFVKNSTHAKTIVEEGGILVTTSSGVFGQVWEVGEDVKISVPTVASSQDVVLMNFTTEAAANAYAALFDGHAARVSGQRAGSATVTKVGDVWQVKSHIEVTAAGKTLTWVGAAGSKWVTPASWSPADIPEPDDALTIDSAADVEMPRWAYANTVSLAAGSSGVALSGKSYLDVSKSISVVGDGSAKAWNVAEGGRVEIATPAFAAENAAFSKTGDGSLIFDFSAINADVAFASVSPISSQVISVAGGELRLKGREPSMTNGKLMSGTGVYGRSDIRNGGRLVLDCCGWGRRTYGSDTSAPFYVGSGDSGDATVVLTNKAMVVGAFYVANNCTVPCKATVAVTNSTLYASAGIAVKFGAASADQYLPNTQVVGRFGSGAKILDCGGGNCDGIVLWGVGNDLEFADGAEVKLANAPVSGTDSNRVRGWVASADRANGVVRFVRGGVLSFKGGFMVQNYNTTVSSSQNLQFVFDGGIFRPMVATYAVGQEDAPACHYAIFREPDHQGFRATGDGMIVDMGSCNRYTIAAPVRGEGELTKTGAGVLVIGTGREFVKSWQVYYPCRDRDMTNATRVVTSGVVTIQNAGGVHVAEGTVEVESGATDTNSTFTVDADCTVDLAGNTVELGMVKGAGVVRNGTISKIQFKPLADGETAAELTDVAVNKAYVDFAGVADPKAPCVIARLGANVTGVLSGTSFRIKAINTGLPGYTVADCTVDDDGNVTAKATSSGFLLIVR